MRVLGFDASLFTPGVRAVLGPSATRVLGTGGSFTVSGLGALTDPFINPLTATFFPAGAMALGQNPYMGTQRFPTVWLSPFVETVPQLTLGDMVTYPDASWFVDKGGNLYTAESDWSRVLIYKDPLGRLRFGAYQGTVAADDPTVYLRLGEPAGPTATDASGHGNDGTYSGTGITYGADALIGFDGDSAITTDGVSGTVTVPLANQTAYTIEAWVKPDVGATRARNIITRTGDSGPTVDWSQQLRITASGVFEHYVSDGQDRVVTGTTPVVAGTVYHVVGTAASNAPMRLLCNGTKKVRQFPLGRCPPMGTNICSEATQAMWGRVASSITSKAPWMRLRFTIPSCRRRVFRPTTVRPSPARLPPAPQLPPGLQLPPGPRFPP